MQAIYGTFVDCPAIGVLRIRDNHLVSLDKHGYVRSIEHVPGNPYELYPDANILILAKGSFVLPTFCDLHLHAPQFLYQGTGLHLPLMQWLTQYAFKAEERIDSDPELARRTYTRLAKRLKEHGTGTVLFFGTIKEESNLILAEVMQSEGVRAFVGKLSMDKSSSETYIETSANASVNSAKSFITAMKEKFDNDSSSTTLVKPVITPRFVPTCSDELLSGLADLAKETNCRIQSHLAEARDQVDWVEKERGLPDIDVFDRHGLLTPRTIQAHCTFLSPTCFSRLQAVGTGIAHCPLSNAYFSSQPFSLREALDAGVKVGLGTDVAGGYSIDIMNSMRNAVMVSRMREGQRTENLRSTTGDINNSRNVSIDWKEALYLATRGGAEALNFAPLAGSFERGVPFDAQQIQLYDSVTLDGIGPIDFLDAPSPSSSITEEMLEKWWCLGDSRNRLSLWTQGKRR